MSHTNKPCKHTEDILGCDLCALAQRLAAKYPHYAAFYGMKPKRVRDPNKPHGSLADLAVRNAAQKEK